MKASLLYLVLFSGIIYVGFSQLPDSLSQQLKTYSTDSARIQFLFKTSTDVFRSNPELNKVVLQEALSIAKEAKMKFLEADAWVKMGIYYVYQDQLDTARALHAKSLERATETSDSLRMATAYGEIGITYYYEENDHKALENFIASYHILKPLDEKKRLASISNNIGNCYQYIDSHEKAIDFYKEAILYKAQVGDSMRLGSSVHNMAISLLALGQEKEAYAQYLKAKSLKEHFNDVRGLASTYSELSGIHLKRGAIDSARYYALQAVNIDRKLGDTRALASDLLKLATIEFDQNEYFKAIQFTEEALGLTKNVDVQKDAMELLGRSYGAEGQFKQGHQMLTNLLQLKDSLHQINQTSKLQNLQVQFDTERKDSEIAQLESDKQIQMLQAERNKQARLVLIIVAIALIIIVILFYLRTKSKAKANQMLDAKNQQLASLNNTKDRLFSIISHDLKSPLSSFHTITNSLTENWERLEKEQLKEFIESLRDSSANVRDMMDNLLKWALTQTNQLTYFPKEVKPKEVITHVQNQLSNTASLKRITIDTNYKSEAPIQTDQQFLEIIVRNLLSNALKFSEMESKVDVLIEENEKDIIINISDTGVGMDQSQIDKLLAGHIVAHDIQNSTEKGTGLGLNLSSELMRKMGARMNVRSEKTKGTTFTLSFPKEAA